MERAAQLTATVRRALEQAGLAGRDALLLVAVSGGADSLALLHALHALRHPCRLRLHVAHLDHGLRPEGAADAAFVAAAARNLGLPCTLERADVPAYRRAHRLSLEDAARRVRYAFLARTAHHLDAAAVALGHTADDQAETLLLHLVRGAGLAGLRGMAPLAPMALPGLPPVLLLRPLLAVARAETAAACREWGLAPRHDVTNASLRFARNRLRLRVLPELERLNPRVRQALLRLGAAAARDLDYLESQAAALWPQVARQHGDLVELDAHALAALHPALRAHLLRHAWQRASGTAQELEEAHLRALEGLLEAPAGKLLHLPGGLRAATGHRRLLLGRDPAALCPFPPLEGRHPLAVPGETRVDGWRVEAQPAQAPAAQEGPWTAHLAPHVAAGGLWVRPWRPGDRLRPAGMEGTRKLQDLFVDAHVPRWWRPRVPLVEGREGILWVVGYRLAAGAAAPPGAPALRLRFTLADGAPPAP